MACQPLCTLTETNEIAMRKGYAFSHLQRAKGLALCGVEAYLELLGKWRIRWAVLIKSSKDPGVWFVVPRARLASD